MDYYFSLIVWITMWTQFSIELLIDFILDIGEREPIKYETVIIADTLTDSLN